MAKKFQAFNPADGAEAIAHAIVESMRAARAKEENKQDKEQDKEGGDPKDVGK